MIPEENLVWRFHGAHVGKKHADGQKTI